jgi:DMSO reductase anchor subunit
MHPAFSVIFLTTLIGVGQGLFLAIYTSQLYALARLLPMPDSQRFFALGSAIALGFLALGLFASFFHLGHPERAWRSAAQWRTSWLSREVILLPAAMALVAAYGVIHGLGWTEPLFVVRGALPVDPSLIVGALGTLATFALFVATGMIYASIRFLREWASPLTVFNFILLGGASGFTLAAAFSAWTGSGLTRFYGTWAVILTVAAGLFRVASLYRNARLQPKSTLQSAIGVRHPRIRQITQGAMGRTFNNREFFHGASPRAVRLVRWFFLLSVFVIPVILLAAAHLLSSFWIPAAAFAVQYLGLLAERWYFFADATHPQNLYYQQIA